MKGQTEPDIRDEVVDFITFKKSQTDLSEPHLLKLLNFERKKSYITRKAMANRKGFTALLKASA